MIFRRRKPRILPDEILVSQREAAEIHRIANALAAMHEAPTGQTVIVVGDNMALPLAIVLAKGLEGVKIS